MKYRWLVDKRKGKVHILNEAEEVTFCRVENNGPGTARRLSPPSTDYPQGKRICYVCENEQHQWEYERTHGELDREFKSILN